MLQSTHKSLLLGLVQMHTQMQREAFASARSVLGNTHPNVQRIASKLHQAIEAQRALESEPETTAA